MLIKSVSSISRIINLFASIRFALLWLALAVVLGLFQGFSETSRAHTWIVGTILIGFFLNLVLSALKRFPYRIVHVPFLLAHVGLVLILVAFGIKYYWGKETSVFISKGEEISLGNPGYSLILKDARQLNYPSSTKTASYECDIIVKKPKETIEKTLTMTSSYKMDEGLRFYLSGIAPPAHAKITIKWVPLAFSLMYVGIFLVSMGIIALYFQQMRKRKA